MPQGRSRASKPWYVKKALHESNNTLELNVAAIQDLLATIVPFVQIEKAIVRKLRVKVSFLTN